MFYAACKVEFQPFHRSYSQLTFFIFLQKINDRLLIGTTCCCTGYILYIHAVCMSTINVKYRATEYIEVVFCRVRTEPYSGHFTGYYPYRNFCKKCMTFTPTPGISVTSVRPWHCTRGTGMPFSTYPGAGTGTAFIYLPGTFFRTFVSSARLPYRTRNFCEFWKSSIPTRIRNFCKFCKTSILLPGTSVSSGRLWHNTQCTGIYAFTFVAITGVPVRIRALPQACRVLWGDWATTHSIPLQVCLLS